MKNLSTTETDCVLPLHTAKLAHIEEVQQTLNRTLTDVEKALAGFSFAAGWIAGRRYEREQL